MENILFDQDDNTYYPKKKRMKRILKTALIAGGAALVLASLADSIAFNAQGQGGLEAPSEEALRVQELLTNAPSGQDAKEAVAGEGGAIAGAGVNTSGAIAGAGVNEGGAIAGQDANEGGAIAGAGANEGLSYFSYRIKEGDMIGYIAEEFGVTQDTIISVNNIKASRLIQIGQYLKIPSMPGIIYTVREDGETAASVAATYEVDAEQCAVVNNLDLDEELSAGQTLFVPGAELDWVTRQEINGDLFTKPIHAWFWYSSRYGWRQSPFDASKRTFHGGIDMACPEGTAIYAALPGRVTECGWSDVYGNYVIVSHHSGYTTLYGHMSQILAWRGENVDTSTQLGKVGSTGQSTGPHLHFTIYKNGRSVNPANLLG